MNLRPKGYTLSRMKTIVFTGGPSGGKTSIMEILRRDLGHKLAIVPEAATILYQGGFPRSPLPEGGRRVQRAIYFVQRELEDFYARTGKPGALLCDRGTLDGPAYWPGGGGGFLRSVGTSYAREAARYDVVFHLRTPRRNGYSLSGTRTESHAQALALDRRIERAWSRHPRRFIIEDEPHFVDKVERVREVLRRELPAVFAS